MSLVLITASARRGSRVRTLSAARVAAIGAVAALVLLGAGGTLGYHVARLTPAEPLQPPAADAQPHPFALEQIGALSARLFRLESQAAQLVQRLGQLADVPARAGEGRTARERSPAPASAPLADPAHLADPAAAATPSAAAAPPGGRGGPLLAPRPAAALDVLDAQLEQLEGRIDRMLDAVALRQSDRMRLPTVMPLPEGELVSPFGNRLDPITSRHAFHAGVDFAAPHGAPIVAAAGGVVDVAGWHPDFGWTVEIEHGNGLRTRYAHASKLLVKRGDVVPPGERIALVGSSGRSTGPHLHFEVLRGGVAVDPRRYLAQR
ncbi:M23 family metallopeptidase [Azohydromonas sediminis]|uniref:M23 family metallopeptidase n=1 Tax=Azohydromonas sediminis TaxID=2259674 RepID=UPI000E6528A4|nr:M23 family metallopeptidase [Azohydromonas sediminis]